MEAAEDFHIFLKSRFNVREIPLNASTELTNVMKLSLALGSSYLVSLEIFILDPDVYTISEGDEKYLVHVSVSFKDADGSFGHYSTRYLSTKNTKPENVFQLIHNLDKDISRFLIEDWYIKKY